MRCALLSRWIRHDPECLKSANRRPAHVEYIYIGFNIPSYGGNSYVIHNSVIWFWHRLYTIFRFSYIHR